MTQRNCQGGQAQQACSRPFCFVECLPACQAVSPVTSVECSAGQCREAPWTRAVLPTPDGRPCCHWLPFPAGQCAPLSAAVPARFSPDTHKQSWLVHRNVRTTSGKQMDQCQFMARCALSGAFMQVEIAGCAILEKHKIVWGGWPVYFACARIAS